MIMQIIALAGLILSLLSGFTLIGQNTNLFILSAFIGATAALPILDTLMQIRSLTGMAIYLTFGLIIGSTAVLFDQNFSKILGDSDGEQ